MTGENASLAPMPGHLYVIATPIGNMADLSKRALAILSQVDCIACEDTRVTGAFLSRLGIKRKLVAYHDRNERSTAPLLLTRLQEGQSLGLVSDAGTPTISDPGFRIVRECRRNGINVVPVPGPVAFATLLSVSGLPTDSFLFIGFLPPKTAARKRFLEERKTFRKTIALYESCHRIDKLLSECEEVLGGDRVICLGRELTKKFETIITGPIAEVRQKFENSSSKGEFVLLISPDGYEL